MLIVWPDAETALCFQDADVCRSRKLCLQILLSIDGVPSSPSLLEVAHDGRRKWRPVHNKMTIRQTVAPLLSTSDVWHALRDRFIADARVERKKKKKRRRKKEKKMDSKYRGNDRNTLSTYLYRLSNWQNPNVNNLPAHL